MKQGLETLVGGELTFYFFRRLRDIMFLFEKFREMSVMIEIPILASTAARAIIKREKAM